MRCCVSIMPRLFWARLLANALQLINQLAAMATNTGEVEITEANRVGKLSVSKSSNSKENEEMILQKIQIVQDEIEKEERYISPSRDARKMYGDITPGDITHQDVTLEYTNHFKHAHRNLPKSFPPEQKYEVWKMSADIVQESFEQNKESIFEKMHRDLEDALDLKKDIPGPLPEEKRDLHRAFKMMVTDLQQNDKESKEMNRIKNKVLEETGGNKETIDFVWDMIIKLDPADYKSFIENEKLRDRKADLEVCYEKLNN